MTADQLRRLGISRSAVAHRVRHRRLQPVLPRVYLAGPGPLTERGRLVAPLLWLGADAVLTGAAALWLWGCLDEMPATPDLLLAGRHVASRDDVSVHRIPLLDAQDIRMRHGLPVTSPALALHDYAGTATDAQLAAALSTARLHRLTTDRELDEVLARHQPRAGTARLRRVLASDQGDAITRSEAERRFLRLIAHADLPRPEVNAHVAGLEVDFIWRSERLVVEIDGYRYHSGRANWEHDHLRDQRLTAAGLRVMRISWHQLTRTPLAVAARVALALAGGAVVPG
ncbi:MAG TPA: DUF559 domain-containing protein [Solirubrobacteraceae bacterium]|nr:DUF559 domain-containing protein [Solirubrobacteraceae bacterium]